MMIGGGTNVREKTYVVVVFAPFQNVPRNGHCLRAKLNLNETKKKKEKEKGGADVAVAAWQNPPLRGGGVRWQRRSERAPCQREGMRYHTVEDGGVRRWCHMHTAVLGGHPGLYPCVVQMLAHFLYEPDKFIWHVLINTVTQTLAIEQWWLLVSNLL